MIPQRFALFPSVIFVIIRILIIVFHLDLFRWVRLYLILRLLLFDSWACLGATMRCLDHVVKLGGRAKSRLLILAVLVYFDRIQIYRRICMFTLLIGVVLNRFQLALAWQRWA